MKRSTKLLALIFVAGLLYSLWTFAAIQGGGDFQGLIEGLYMTSLMLFFSALLILLTQIRNYKDHLDTLVILILSLPMAVQAMKGKMENRRYNRMPDLTNNYPRPVTKATFTVDSMNIL